MPSSRIDNISFSTFEYQKYDPEHTALYQRTWSQYIESGQGKALTERQIQAYYHQNPHGNALLTIAAHQGSWVGSVAAVPTRCGQSDSEAKLFYQVADFMVDPSFQGQGVGTRLVAHLTEVLSDRNYLTYTFPNTRSSGVFLKNGYRIVREIPTRIFLPQIESIIQRSDSNLKEISLFDAERAAEELTQANRQHYSIIKDGAYIKWRYTEIRSMEDYQFYVLHSNNNQLHALIVTTVYRFSGVPFLIILDLIVREDSDLSSVFSRNIPGHSPLQLGFSTIDADYPKARIKAGVRVPKRFNPRPVILLSRPNSDPSFDLASSCRFVTADWHGF